MGCNQSSETVAEITPQSRGSIIGHPKFLGTDKASLFNGLLYRFSDANTGEWAFYNNSQDYEFHISYLFGSRSEITPLDDTKMKEQDDGILCTTIVYPLETKMFIKGMTDGYESKLEALPLSEEYFGTHPEVDERAYYRRLEPPPSSAFEQHV